MHGVVVVEDHEIFAEVLCSALCERDVHAEYVQLCEPADLLAALLERQPQLIVLDLDLGRFGDSTWMIDPLTAQGIPVLVLTGSGDRMRIAAALEHGAISYQHKSAGFHTLVAQITAAISATGPLDCEDREALLVELRAARIQRARLLEPFARLTERERNTLEALAQGRSVHQLSRDWVLSEATVRTHVRSLLAKLNVPSQLAAVSLALRSGWMDSSAHAVAPAPARPVRAAELLVS
jgi:DNA-binding NarL/FixJ family response regulator